jgi:hypothetical protein
MRSSSINDLRSGGTGLGLRGGFLTVRTFKERHQQGHALQQILWIAIQEILHPHKRDTE